MPVQSGHLDKKEFMILWELLNEKSRTPQEIVAEMISLSPESEPVHVLETLKLLSSVYFVESHGTIYPAYDGEPANHRHSYTITNTHKKYSRKKAPQKTTAK